MLAHVHRRPCTPRRANAGSEVVTVRLSTASCYVHCAQTCTSAASLRGAGCRCQTCACAGCETESGQDWQKMAAEPIRAIAESVLAPAQAVHLDCAQVVCIAAELSCCCSLQHSDAKPGPFSQRCSVYVENATLWLLLWLRKGKVQELHLAAGRR